MTPAQYRLHRQSTMRAAMRASALFLRLPCGAAVSSSWDRAPGAGYWVEVKGNIPEQREMDLLCELAAATGHIPAYDEVRDAMHAARQARFEHGQVGAPTRWDSPRP